MSYDDEDDTSNMENTSGADDVPRRTRRKRSHKECRYNKRIVKSNTGLICPVCQLTLRSGDVESHYAYEYQKLIKCANASNISRKIPSILRKSSSPSVEDGLRWQESATEPHSAGASNSCVQSLNDCQPSTSNTQSNLYSNASLSRSKKEYKEPGLESYKRVRVNRLLRRQCLRWKSRDVEDETICPVCEEPVPVQSPEELQIHADMCLRMQLGEEVSDEEVDVEGDEYEWCGIKRVRITSLLKSQGQLDSLGTMVTQGNEDEHVEVCLLQDEDNQFGPSQYSQEDLDSHSVNMDEISSEDARNSVETPSVDQPLTESSEEFPEGGQENTRRHLNSAVVEALEVKIRELEEEGSFICHICHGPYIIPVASTVCWHVHCEKCWLLALSSQRLCPQCKAIVSPTELRKIFL